MTSAHSSRDASGARSGAPSGRPSASRASACGSFACRSAPSAAVTSGSAIHWVSPRSGCAARAAIAFSSSMARAC
ncbi:hypothetical protein IHE61_27225 [Streptomyces sp. GKU 257-1]|nr:hypothetical protein [Streptomyces sp. GKU 257-1]